MCYDDDSGVTDKMDNASNSSRQPWGVAPIDFLYSIDTNFSPESLSLEEKEAILSSVSATIIESVYEYACLPKRTRKRRRQSAVSSFSSASSSRRAEILSISPGFGHEWLGDCDFFSNKEDSGSFCSEIQGTVLVAFDGNNRADSTKVVASDFESVGNVVLSRIEEDMMNGIYIDKINAEMRNLGVTITTMNYIDSDYPELAAQDAFGDLNTNAGLLEADLAGMSVFSKVAIPMMVILSLLAMGLCWYAIVSRPTDLFSAQNRSANPKSGTKRDEADGRKHNNNSKNVDTGKNEKHTQKSSKESSRALTVEATLQDLSNTEKLTYGDQNAMNPSRSFNQKSSTTHSFRSTQASRGATQARNQSSMNAVDRNNHPSDTETGSCGHSVEMHNGVRGNAPYISNVGLVKDGHRRTRANASFSASKARRNVTPIRALSSFFGIGNWSGSNPVMDRIGACASIPNNHCFGDEQELPPRLGNSEDTFLRYGRPINERNNSLVQAEPHVYPNKSAKWAMGAKKSAAYREYINKKVLQRNTEYGKPDEFVPMEIGVKRTFTDSQGRIREMVAL